MINRLIQAGLHHVISNIRTRGDADLDVISDGESSIESFVLDVASGENKTRMRSCLRVWLFLIPGILESFTSLLKFRKSLITINDFAQY